MKKILLLTVMALVLLFAMAGSALADGGPHGGYTPTTDACAGCHRAHTAAAPRLLTTPVESLCLSCHGTAGTGADTNVEDGVFTQRDLDGTDGSEGVVDRGLRGGGFVNTWMNSSFAAAAPAGPVASTSAHTADGADGTMWGNGALGSGAGTALGTGIGDGLSCVNCHDPHGNGNYRILRPIPNGSGAAAAVNVADEGTKLYTVDFSNGQYFGQGRTSVFAMTPQYEGVSGWCVQCHTRYLGDPDSGITDSTDPIFAYRHMAGAQSATCSKCHNGAPSAATVVVTYNADYFNHQVECMTCHVAHGTAADMTTDGPYSGAVLWPDGSNAPSGDARSSLLRVDGRGVCQGCHDKSGTSAPAPPP